MYQDANSKVAKPKPRCEVCNGGFGLIRHRFAHKEFCSKRCLDHYLAESKQRPSHFKQWIDFSRGQGSPSKQGHGYPAPSTLPGPRQYHEFPITWSALFF